MNLGPPEPGRDPKAVPKVVIVTKAVVAKSQLETAIVLWFTEGDPVSIHALAVAAQDCYRALAAHAKIDSPFEVWAKSQSPGFQTKLHDAQNFFKHGPNQFKGKLHLMTMHGEVLMFDAAICHKRLFGEYPPLMFLYAFRFCIENPHISALRFEPGYEWFKVDAFVNVSRRQLFIDVFPALLKAHRARQASANK